ncbi:MAG: hypothetical protein WBM17_05170 [Anaerolineales bacterium]
MNPSPFFIVYTASLLCVSACIMAIILRSLLWERDDALEKFSVPQPPKSHAGLWFILVILFGLGISGYYVLRYHGLWMETDSATITLTIESLRREAILPPTRYSYQGGFGYQAVSVALLYATGLTTQTLQTIVYPLLAAVGLMLSSFIFFREVLRDHRVAALASMLLIFQPDILFVTMRGSHEKMTWPLMMLALAFLYRSFGQPLRKMAVYVGLYYLVVFALDTTNVFFGSVFLVAVVLSMTLGFFLFRFWTNRRPPLPRQDVQRLMYISLSGGILIYIFIMYLYPPALANLRMLRNVIDQLSALLLSFEIKAQPYGYISLSWINPQVYLMLTAFTWMLIATSFLEWLRHGWKMLKGEAARGLVENLDWLLYTGFAIQIAISILVDLSGALSANMQLRLFPSFTIMAIVLLVRSLRRIFAASSLRINPRRVLLGLSALLSAWFTLATVLKATNDPSLCNKWTFYLPTDKAAVRWVDAHLRQVRIWDGIDERLNTIYNSFFLLDSQGENIYRYGEVNTIFRYVLLTDLDRLRMKRLGIQLLPVSYWDQLYDNGAAQLDRIPLYLLESP